MYLKKKSRKREYSYTEFHLQIHDFLSPGKIKNGVHSIGTTVDCLTSFIYLSVMFASFKGYNYYLLYMGVITGLDDMICFLNACISYAIHLFDTK